MSTEPYIPSDFANRSVAEARADGRERRKATPRRTIGEWAPAADRPDPVGLIEATNADRVPELLPLRRARMLVSPFTYFRGAPAVMAWDLAQVPNSGFTVQACGDAHLSNFGAFGSPERNLIFDVNDFDETLPGPWEFDVARLAASLVVAGRDNGFADADSLGAATMAGTAYIEAMGRYANFGSLQLWYDLGSVAALEQIASPRARKQLEATVAQARKRTGAQALRKLTETVDGEPRFLDRPPTLFRLGHFAPKGEDDIVHTTAEEVFHGLFARYRPTMEDSRGQLLDRYRLVDAAFKVVGVGSVGTRCGVVAFVGRNADDVLVLQIKEAQQSVLEPYVPAHPFTHQGHRVVTGQRRMQAASDPFLGWTEGPMGRHFYVRQLRDMKLSADIAAFTPDQLRDYAAICGATLARGHARSGDAAAIAGYLGNSSVYADALARFAVAYADQNRADYELFRAACGSGGLEVAADTGN